MMTIVNNTEKAPPSSNKMTESAQSIQQFGLRLRFAAEKGRLQEVRKLLALGAPVVRDANGLSALHKAAKHGHTAVVRQLIASRHFNINQPDKYGWTPLHWASWNGHVTTINTLITNNRCNINVLDKSGSNALHCAALNGHASIISVLVSAKCDPDCQRRDGWTPLHLASWNGHQDVLHELIEIKCKINVRTNNGMGALHLAAAKGYNDIAQELLDSGIAPDMQDKLGNTAVHEATRWRQPATVKLLVQSYCRINMRNNEGDAPMDIARREDYKEIVAEFSGLNGSGTCNLEDSCGCAELKRLLFHDKSMLKCCNDPKKLMWVADNGKDHKHDSKEAITPRDQVINLKKSWQEKLEDARAEVVAKYESRIAEVEKRCKNKVDLIERQCSKRMISVQKVISDSVLCSVRSPSAPDMGKSFVIFRTPSNRSFNRPISS